MTLPALTVYADGGSAVSADNLNTFVQSADVANDLRNISGVSGMSVQLRGLTSINDGSGGAFYWDASNLGPDDGTNIIMPFSSVQGAWVRQIQTPTSTGATAAATSLTSGVTAGLCTVTLAKIGIWAVSGEVTFSPTSSSTTIAFLSAGLASSPANNTTSQYLAAPFTTGSTNALSTGTAIIQVAASTTITLEAQANFGVSGMQASGLLQAAMIGGQGP
jgi:hypothetical protein